MQTVIETSTGWMIKCRACGWHEFPKVGKRGANWSFNGNMERPTFSPSMNQTMTPTLPEIPMRRCHLIVTDGQIKYCSDCTHELKGQTMPLEAFSEAEVRIHAAQEGGG